jgi:large repetitive protein
MWSREVIGSPARPRSSSVAGSGKNAFAARGRRAIFEQLEDRRLLSVGVLHPQSTGQAALLAGSLLGESTPSSVASNAAPILQAAAAGPVIGQVVVSMAKAKISWNVSDTLPVGATLQIDGVLAQGVSGPFPGASGGVNFSAPIRVLSLGSHSFLITATDAANFSTTFSGTLNVTAPIISQVTVSLTTGKISWNAASSNGVAFSTLRIDGVTVPNVGGPFANPSGGVNFSAPLGSLTGGQHTYVITATDTINNSSTATNTFNINATGPVIGQVGISQASGRISWNVSGVLSVAASSLLIDGKSVSPISGPFTAPSGGFNFSAPLGTLSVGSHTYRITVTDSFNNSSTATASFDIGSPTPGTGPTISQVVVSQLTGRISWNAADPDGVTSSTLTIDGAAVSGVLGPFSAPSGVNFSAPIGFLADGTHSFTITATDGANNTSSFSDTFAVGASTGSGPTISQVLVSGPADTITWHAADSDGVASSTLTIDHNAVTVVGPGGTPTSADFSASLGLLNSGPHTFTITTTDVPGNVSTLTANFTLDTQTSVGPTLSQVSVSASKARISWNALDTTGVTGSTLSIDGQFVSNIAGPFPAASGVNFSAPLDSLLAGTHTYSITGFDGLGSQATTSGTFTLAATTTFDPMISQVIVSQANGKITWNVFDPDGVASSTLQIDGVAVANVLGPFNAASGVNFSGRLGSLSAGSHSYRITATDKLGHQSAVLANFNLTAAAGAAQNAVFSAIGTAPSATSAKVDWTLDLSGLADNTPLIA